MDDDLIEWAHLYALHALDDEDLRALDARLADADETTGRSSTPPCDWLARRWRPQVRSSPSPRPRHCAATCCVRCRVTTSRSGRNSKRRWQITMASVAAAVVLLVGGVVIGRQLTETPPATPVTAQILAASDMHSVTAEIPGGGTATTMYSKEANAAMLVMNGVTPPKPDTVYQMWLVRGDEPVPAGTMGPDQVSPTTTAVLEGIDGATQLGFTVEPPGGSSYPTGTMFASIPLT
ncbi:anti-sigma factor [Rhodococcus hoagii]|nr:anti-sigma factor [Prescottella equi]